MSDMKLTRAQIRAVFLDSGFTIKPGEDDLQPYVYEAAEALLAAQAGAAAPHDERDLFESAYIDDALSAGVDLHRIKSCRSGEGYGRFTHLDGCWSGWKLGRAALPAQAVASVPKGLALVPIRLTRAMSDVMDEEGWQWDQLLEVAGAITEQQYAELAAPVQDVAPSAQQASELAADILIQLSNEAPINGNNLAQRRVLWAAAQLRSGAPQSVAKDVAPSDAPAVSNASIALPWPWETAAQVLADAIDRIEGQDKLKDALRILAAQPAAQPADAQADMFWDKDNPESDLHAENLGEAIDYLADEIPLNELPIEVTLMRAKRLPNIRVRITGYVDGEGHTYEVITEARTQEGAAP